MKELADRCRPNEEALRVVEHVVGRGQRLEYAGKIDSQINKMTWLIKNLLTLSQLEAGVLEMKTEAVSLKAMLDDLADPLSVLAEVAEVDLKCSIPETIQIRAVFLSPSQFGPTIPNMESV